MTRLVFTLDPFVKTYNISKLNLCQIVIFSKPPNIIAANISRFTVINICVCRTAQAPSPLNYPRLSLLLEVIQTRPKVKDREMLAAGLFSLLGRLLHDTHEENEFCKQMALTCLLNICAAWRQDTKPQNQGKYRELLLFSGRHKIKKENTRYKDIEIFY